MSDNDAILISGPWFEDFHVGLQFDAPAITLTEGHAALYQALFGDRMRLPLDRHASARISGVDRAIAHPLLAINVAIGQSTWASQRVKANLFYRGLLLQRPVFLGDTLYTRTRVVALRQNRMQEGRAATGIVALSIPLSILCSCRCCIHCTRLLKLMVLAVTTLHWSCTLSSWNA